MSLTGTTSQKLTASFRDPSGFIFKRNGKFLRQVNHYYKENYDLLMSGGLYDKLAEKKLIIPHTETSDEQAVTPECYKIIEPQQLDFISYPYEWSFSQFKDAALTTLEIQRIALDLGMTLKDASAYNIQFIEGRPVFIDTLSFEKYNDGEPWIAYKQFCQHFLAPLVLMSYKDVRLNKLLVNFIDGIPLDLVSKLLPGKTKFNLSILTHIHFHASTQKKYESEAKKRVVKVSKTGLLGIIDNLNSLIKNLQWNPGGTEWADYYDNTNYNDTSFANKKTIITGFLKTVSPKSVWDLGANTGVFSRIASNAEIKTIAFDIDPAAVEKNYLRVRKEAETFILPLVIDLTNPSPGIGWANEERPSFGERRSADVVMALALIHHLAISNNLPFEMIASYFSRLCKYLIIEFVPKSDSQVKRLLTTRKDIFDKYNQSDFEKLFSEFFEITEKVHVGESERTLYLMKTK